MQTVNFRQSELKRYLRCPRQYAYCVLDGVAEEGTTGAMFAGTVFHRAVENSVGIYLATGAYPEPEDTEGVFLDAWDAVEEQEGEIRWLDGETPQNVAQRLFPQFQFWREQIAPALRPVLSEVRFQRLEVAPGVTIEGTIDLVEVGGRIRDWKTAKRKWQAPDVKRDVQSRMYSLAYLTIFGTYPTGFDFEVFVKGHEALHQHMPTDLSVEDIERFKVLLQEWAEAVRSELFPTNPTGWWCSQRYCPAWDVCPAGAGPQVYSLSRKLERSEPKEEVSV